MSYMKIIEDAKVAHNNGWATRKGHMLVMRDCQMPECVKAVALATVTYDGEVAANRAARLVTT